ncbi:GtrA family protein [Ruminococcaceae bacterium OttesenSCG-928-I18]|nr:GtrA family protein [Ruminococcaceae bacterium OttesenSCG-928-I18]
MKQTIKSLVRFAMFGILTTALDFMIYMLLNWWLPYSASKLISMCIASAVSFFLNKKWTFRNTEKISPLLVLKFICGQMANIGVNVGVNALMILLTGLVLLSFVVATGTAMIVNYTIQRLFVFSGRRERRP